MPIVRGAETRRTETPNAVMTTLASPTLGGAEQCIWRVEMRRGQAGPLHTFSLEQVWTVLQGAARVELGGEDLRIAAGDTIVMAAGISRRVHADSGAGLTAIVAMAVGGRVALADGTDGGVPAWVA